MHWVDFTESNAQKSSFANCDLKSPPFKNTVPKSADFSTAYNYSISPSDNQIKHSTFSKDNCFGLLNTIKIRIKSHFN